MTTLSIIIPVYNEAKIVKDIIDKIKSVDLGQVKKELIVVNDCSTDNTINILTSIEDIKLFSHEINMGKGYAVRTGIQQATGDLIIIQDADLEYDPADYKDLIKPIINNETQVVYGSRYIKEGFKPSNKIFYLGNRFLSLMTQILYSAQITDMETCYKVFRKTALDGITLKSKGFEFEPEITAKFIKKGHKIIEVPISYSRRTVKEGKKLRPIKDGMKALFFLIKYRFMN